MNEEKIKAIYLQREELRQKRAPLVVQVAEIEKQITALELEAERLQYPCECVRLNSELSVYSMEDQEEKNRHGLTCGAIYRCLSADNGCPLCHGSGIPQ